MYLSHFYLLCQCTSKCGIFHRGHRLDLGFQQFETMAVSFKCGIDAYNEVTIFSWQ